PVGVDADERGAERFGERDVTGKRLPALRIDAIRALVRRLDVNGVPLRAQPPGDPGPGANDPRRVLACAHADHDAFRDDSGLEPLASAVTGRLLTHLVGDRPQGQLAES